MSARRKVRRKEGESTDESASNTNSRDDENLMQNWSLTFTEYATDQPFVKTSDKNGNSDGNPSNGFEHQKYSQESSSQRAPDGRGKHYDKDGPHAPDHQALDSQQIRQQIKSAGREKSEKLEVKIPRVGHNHDKLPVTLQGVAMNLESASDRKSARQTKSVSGSAKSRVSSKTASSFIVERKQELVRAGTPKQVALPKKEDLAKHTVLPTILNRSPSTEKILTLRMPQGRALPDDTIRRVAPGDARLAPKTPPPVGVGKVQPIYVRFPGQRTGQMML